MSSILAICKEVCFGMFETNVKLKFPNGHTTSNRRRFDVDITSIRRRPNFDEFSRRFHVLLSM